MPLTAEQFAALSNKAKAPPASASKGGISAAQFAARTAKPAEKPAVDITPGFLSHAKETVKDVGRALTTNPLAVGEGGLHAVVSGAYSLADLAAQGYSGTISAIRGKGFAAGAEAASQQLAANLGWINLAPANQEEEAAGRLLSLLPEGIKAAGDTIYEKTGSAFLGASTQAGLTLLTLKPAFAAKSLRVVDKSPKAAADFKAMAAANPDGAAAVVDHVRKADPELAKALDKHVDAVEKVGRTQREDIGAKAAEADSAKPRVQVVGATPEGKPRVRVVSPEQASAGMRTGVREGYAALEEKPIVTGAQDPVVFMEAGKPVTKGEVSAAARAGPMFDRLPGAAVAKGKLRSYADQFTSWLNVEGLGREAEIAGSTIRRVTWSQMQKASARWHTAGVRRAFWNARMDEAPGFLDRWDRGTPEPTKQLAELREGYTARLAETYTADKAKGVEYEPLEHYMPRLFVNPEGAAAELTRRYGTKWGDPSFTKDRIGATYAGLIKAGFKPRFSNPEDIVAAREHASDIAHTRIGILEDLEKFGVAVRIPKGGIEKGPPAGFSTNIRRSPNGNLYWLHEHAEALAHNAWDTTSLWELKNMWGDLFRGAMAAKNTVIPIRLMSLFHFFHEAAGLDNANSAMRAMKGALAGTTNPVRAFGQLVRSAVPFYESIWSNPKLGHPLLRAFRGQISEDELTPAQKQGLWLMSEGGMAPEMPSEYKTSAVKNFQDAWQQHRIATIVHAVPAALQATMTPMFDHWIPSLKIAAYLKNAAQVIAMKPELMSKPLDRQIALARIRKGIDARYGEMAYDTLFWPRWVKDLGVLNTLALGWQMGVLKQFGGAPVDLFKLGPRVAKDGWSETVKSGGLDKPLFAVAYTAIATSYTGLFSYMMSGQPPQGEDWINPRIGGAGPDGKPLRVTTMFFTKEFSAFYKHAHNQGVVEGLSDLVVGKASGIIGMAGEALSGVNGMGDRIRQEGDGFLKETYQTISALLKEQSPIAVESYQKLPVEKGAATVNVPLLGKLGVKNAALSLAGLSAAPKYSSETPTESAIATSFHRYAMPAMRSYEKAQYSKEFAAVRKLYNADDPGYGPALDKLADQFGLSAKDQGALEKSLAKESREDSNESQRMFQRLEWREQKRLLDAMEPKEREQYLPFANKKHLRYAYEAAP